MNSFLGMDTAQVRAHSHRLRSASDDVEGLRDRLTTMVTGTDWQGPDAQQFRARFDDVSTAHFTGLCQELTALSERVAGEAAEQDAASRTAELDAAAGGGAGAGGRRSPTPGSAGDGSGYLDRDRPWIPNWLEDPLEAAVSDLAGLVSEGIGRGFDTGMDGITWAAGRVGLDTDGLDQARGDLRHLGELLDDWATGERVPTIAELGASALLAVGSAAIAPVELFTDTGFLDPRTDVSVHAVNQVDSPSTPQHLADLISANDEARREMFGRTEPAAYDRDSSGQIRIQAVRAMGGDTAYIVHAPPTGGAGIADPDAWGAQGNSAGWDSNLRSMGGQDSAPMADIRAAMEAAGPDGQPLVPPGADVMFVGHSQGGLTAAQLAADPSFNNSSGAPGSYNVTHSFSVGSPVETAVPAQGSTQVVNVAHNPVWRTSPLAPGLPFPGYSPTHIADPVPRLDLDGYRIDGSRVSAPNVKEAWLDAPQQTYGQRSQLHNAHDSVLHTAQGVDPTGGYHGSVSQNTAGNPVLSQLQRDLEGQYVGAGVAVVSDQVVEVGREDRRG